MNATLSDTERYTNALRALYAAPATELAGQLVEACDALPKAATKANELLHDDDVIAMDLLERVAERANGIARLALRIIEGRRREKSFAEAPAGASPDA